MEIRFAVIHQINRQVIMKNKMKYMIASSFYLMILLIGSSLFSACSDDNEPATIVPPVEEEDGNEPNEPSGEMGDPSQTDIYLWLEGNMPATTSYQTVANSSNPDGPDFRPNIIRFPVVEGVPIKGAVLLCAGGAFQFRGNSGDCFPVARELNALGYQCFVVNYRLRPYTQQEGAQDLARAVRFVRLHADYYGIDADKIVVAGFSAGGILCGEQVLNYRGTVNGSSLDSRYVPDELDNISADVKGIGHIYSFYGRLSVGSTDVELFRRSNLPPTFYCWGTTDGFAGQFTANANAVEQAGVAVERYILEGWPHGYGARGNWIPTFDRWMTNVFNN
ncbi:alpha/beta hydrolase [Dysgonomonas sp. 521]|nr:alpha/beta hydrolase [Dysgonomonas sp. 521]